MTLVNASVLLILIGLLFCLTYYHHLPGTCLIDPTLERLRRDLIKVDTRLGRLQYFPGDESYTEDKERIFLCMKDDKDVYYDYNTLLQVALHEGAHALTRVIDKDHKTKEFNDMHEVLRKRASTLGLVDLTKNVSTGYCPKKDS